MLRGRTTSALLASKERGVGNTNLLGRCWSWVFQLPCSYWKAGWTYQRSRYTAQHQWIVKSSRSTSRRRIASTREELNNTIVQQLSEKMSAEQLRANYLAKMNCALSWLTTLPLRQRTSTITKGNSTMRSAVGTAGHWSTCTSRIDVLAARDSTLIMQCRVQQVDLSIGGMTTCEICSHAFSWMYTMILRSSHTFRPW